MRRQTTDGRRQAPQGERLFYAKAQKRTKPRNETERTRTGSDTCRAVCLPFSRFRSLSRFRARIFFALLALLSPAINRLSPVIWAEARPPVLPPVQEGRPK